MDNLDISKVHIVLIRHAEAISNVKLPAPDGTILSMDQLNELAGDLKASMIGVDARLEANFGLPDGLTQHGLHQADVFVDDVTQGGGKLDNVYMLASSPLTRAYQTIVRIQKAFGFSGRPDFTEPSELDHPTIHVHSGIKESSLFPQDLPPMFKGNEGGEGDRIASYVVLAGGRNDPGRVLGEQEVDFTRAKWEDGPAALERWNTPQARLDTLRAPPSLQQVEEGVKNFRLFLRESAATILREHTLRGREGIPKIVVCLHGGIINFLTQRWSCVFKHTKPDQWTWKYSTMLRNLDVCVFAFSSMMDEDAELQEVDRSCAYYVEKLGKHYRHLHTEEDFAVPDQVFQKAQHWSFIERSADLIPAGPPAELEALLTWKGAEDFQSRFPGA